MRKIPTASEFLEKQELKIAHNMDRDGIAYPSTHCEERMIAFAKLHVKAALEAGAKELVKRLKENPNELVPIKGTIVLAYPLNNIQ